jgi:signal transduction histidine kinase
MRGTWRRFGSRRRRLSLLIAAVLVLMPMVSAWAAQAQPSVLVLYSVRRDTQLAVLGDQELPRMLKETLGSVDFYSEYMDVPRFPGPEYEAAVHDYLELKYNRRRFDLVIAVQDLASEFVAKYRDDLFPGSPVVFAATDPPRIPKSTAIRLTVDLAKTVDLATALQPDTRQIFVINGASARDAVYERMARTQLRQFENRFAITYLSDLPAADLERRLATLPEHSIIYYVLFYQDVNGQNFEPLDYLDRLSGLANRPVYSWTDTTIGRGVVGGALRSVRSQLNTIGRQAIQVLRGAQPDRMGVITPDLLVSQVDWRQLQRWGIPEARVPSGTLIEFREPGPWEQYKAYILGGTALILAQMTLITGLLVMRARRRRAEEQLRASQAELGTSYERARDLGVRLLGAQEAERSRIARELHDDIGQQLAVVSVDLGLLRRAAREGSADLDDLIFNVFERLNLAAKNLHDIGHRLHPATLRLIGIVPALTALVRETASSGLQAAMRAEDVPDAIAPDVTLCLYRVAQEAIHNAVRHSRCRALAVRLVGSGQQLTLTVSDDGHGFDVSNGIGRGLGLVSMRERVESLGGRLTIESTPAIGTRIEAIVPYTASSSGRSLQAVQESA